MITSVGGGTGGAGRGIGAAVAGDGESTGEVARCFSVSFIAITRFGGSVSGSSSKDVATPETSA